MIYCFNPLFGGVWLLNRAKNALIKKTRSSFNPLFGGVWLLNRMWFLAITRFTTSFNPLFGGVWLLNFYYRDTYVDSELLFQSFIWWSMAFEYLVGY